MTKKQVLTQEYIKLFGFSPKKGQRAVDIERAIKLFNDGIARALSMKP